MGRWDKKKQKNTLSDDIYKELLNMYQSGKGRSRKILQELQKIESIVHPHMKDIKDSAKDFLNGSKKNIQR